MKNPIFLSKDDQESPEIVEEYEPTLSSLKPTELIEQDFYVPESYETYDIPPPRCLAR